MVKECGQWVASWLHTQACCVKVYLLAHVSLVSGTGCDCLMLLLLHAVAVPDMTCNVFGVTLNPTQLLHAADQWWDITALSTVRKNMLGQMNSAKSTVKYFMDMLIRLKPADADLTVIKTRCLCIFSVFSLKLVYQPVLYLSLIHIWRCRRRG